VVQPDENIDKFSCSGVYKLKCKRCEKVYTGQMGRSFTTHYAEHISDIKHNRDISKYAKHILDHLHEYGTKEETMDIIKVIDKGNHMDAHEKFHIYKYNRLRECLNEQNTNGAIILFDILLKRCRNVDTPGSIKTNDWQS
jgi:hypothetical protein